MGSYRNTSIGRPPLQDISRQLASLAVSSRIVTRQSYSAFLRKLPQPEAPIATKIVNRARSRHIPVAIRRSTITPAPKIMGAIPINFIHNSYTDSTSPLYRSPLIAHALMTGFQCVSPAHFPLPLTHHFPHPSIYLSI